MYDDYVHMSLRPGRDVPDLTTPEMRRRECEIILDLAPGSLGGAE
ncbi:hypothetical protein [Actinomadura flavalba]|nr:hypothetical protein [Actinomadura flavalba]